MTHYLDRRHHQPFLP